MAHAYIHHLNPWVFRWGNFGLSWYWLFYLLGFLGMFYWLKKSLLDQSRILLTPFVDIMVYGWLGVLIGGRLGYVLFYEPVFFFSHPQLILQIWLGGMSFHGAILFGGLAVWRATKKYQLNYFIITDYILVFAPAIIGLGRIGNFINGELWGRPSRLPWSVVFPLADLLPRHPSQLYEAAGEGFLLSLVVAQVFRKSTRPGQTTLAFLFGYASIRFLLEFFREPDRQIGYILGPLSLGQLLCILMFVFALIVRRQLNKAKTN